MLTSWTRSILFVLLYQVILHSEAAVLRDVKEPFTFDDIFSSDYRTRSFYGNWISDHEFLYRDSNSGIVMRVNANDQSETIFINNSTFYELWTGTYYVSADLEYVLFAYDIESVWRHSYTAKYAVLNVDSKALTYIAGNKTLQYAGWSASGHRLSYVYENNLYYMESPTSTDGDPITTDGDKLYIFNGIPDWLYEEDVLSDRVAHYWSPSSDYICFAQFNDTDVPLQPWPLYGSKSQVHVQTRQIAYPKAGDVRNGEAGPNTKVKLFVYDVSSSGTAEVLPPAELQTVDHYYVQVKWRNDVSMMVTWTNRVQNHSYSVIYNVNDTDPITPSITNKEENVTGGWVQVEPAAPVFINDGESYLTILPEPSAADGPFRHLALVTSPDDAPAGTVSYFKSIAGEEVDYILGYDAANNFVYYRSTYGIPDERHILRATVTSPDSDAKCLTCNEPSTCRYTSGSFSTSASYYIFNCYGPDVPSYTLRKVNDTSYKEKVFEDNSELKENLKKKDLPERQFVDVSVGGGYTGRAEVYVPTDLGNEKRPLLFYAYAGPGTQRVVKTFPMGSTTYNWLAYLRSTHRVVVASLDGRGSSGAGDKLKFEMYRRLSTVEVQDQITGGDHFREQSYVNSSRRSAIFGWSYGGGVAAHVIGDTNITFTCGLSVAPVSTKAYYDTAYTERYLALATPGDNEAGYDGTDVMNKVKNFHDKKYFIAHGTADDNVHYMHAAHLIRALEEEGIQFRQSMYADQNHGIGSPNLNRHLYASMTDFLLNDCWPGVDGDGPDGPDVSSALTQRYDIVALSSLLTVLTVIRQYILA